MRVGRIGFKAATCLLLVAAAGPALADVFTSEFLADPVSEGWGRLLSYCEPRTWNEGGQYHQELDLEACPPGPGGGRDVYRHSLQPFDGVDEFFVEFRLETDGDRSEIPGVAPAGLVLGNNVGVIYHITVSRDLVKFLRDFDLPILFIEMAPEVPHAYRVELFPDRFLFYIDGELIDEGPPQGPFPADTPRITWQGNSWYLPCHNAWDFIRYGVIPEDGSGDYDSDGAVTGSDYYFFHDCLTKDGPGIFGGPEQDAGPGCRFADFDADAAVDLLDFAEFQNLFNGPHP